MISSFGFTDEGALYFLNAKIGRWLADQFADSNVTTAKIGDAQVTTAKITDANVTTGKIADDAVTTAKMASNSVTSDTIASGITLAGTTTLTATSNHYQRFTGSTIQTVVLPLPIPPVIPILFILNFKNY